MVQSVSPTVGKYTLGERIQRDGPGEVYRAHYRRQQVVIRLLPAGPADSPDLARRFEAEMGRLATIDHPHIVPLLGYGQQDGAPYLVTPPVFGEHLGDRFARNRPAADELPGYLRPIGEALDYAHARGVAHGDLQPTNVFVDEEGLIQLADFGLAGSTGGAAAVENDIVALARLAYQGLTGQPLTEFSPSNAPAPAQGALRKALVRSETGGYATAGEFVADLAAALAAPGSAKSTDAPAPEMNGGAAVAAPSPATPRHPRRSQAFLPESAAARRVAAIWVAATLLIGLVLGGGFVLLNGRGDSKVADAGASKSAASKAPASAAPIALAPTDGLPYRFPVDNALIARKYAEAQGRLPQEARDAGLHRFAAECFDPRASDDCLLVYVFYSKQADGMYNYHFKVQGDELIGDFVEPAVNDDYRIVFRQLPWEKNPNWARLLDESHAQLPENFAPGGFTAALVAGAAANNDGVADWAAVYVDISADKQHIFELLGDKVTRLPE